MIKPQLQYLIDQCFKSQEAKLEQQVGLMNAVITPQGAKWGREEEGLAPPQNRKTSFEKLRTAMSQLAKSNQGLSSFIKEENEIPGNGVFNKFHHLKTRNKNLADVFRSIGDLIESASQISFTQAGLINSAAKDFIKATNRSSPLHQFIKSLLTTISNNTSDEGTPRDWDAAIAIE